VALEPQIIDNITVDNSSPKHILIDFIYIYDYGISDPWFSNVKVII